MFRISDGLARYMAPLLVFTGDEIYEALHQSEPGAVHEREFPPLVPADHALIEVWKPLLEAREAALKAMETARAARTIASSLEASLVLKGPPKVLAALRLHEAPSAPFPGSLANLFIVSQVKLEPTEGGELEVKVSRADGVKCSRCWTYSPSHSGPGEGDTRGALCPRCREVVGQGAAS
jgi:isoleucyl-tRNA synthetase